MNNYKLNIIYKDGSSNSVWIVDGRYKIVRYDYRHSNGYTEKRETFHAYYRPRHFSNWGNHVNKQTPSYDTLADALLAVDNFDQVRGSEAINGGSIN